MHLQYYLNTHMNILNLVEKFPSERALNLEFESTISPLLNNFDEPTKINPLYFNRIYSLAIKIFETIFEHNDEIYFVVHDKTYCTGNSWGTDVFKKKRTNIFKRFLKNSQDKYKIQYNYYSNNITLPIIPLGTGLEENGRDGTIEYSILLQNKDRLLYQKLIRTICNTDFPVTPKISYCPPIFFVNKTKNIILYIYDDRGCHIVFKDTTDLSHFIEKNPYISDLIYQYSE